MSIQWYPGHIAKARREIKNHLNEIDIVIEIIDARCPLSSINFLNEEIKDKKHLIVFNKNDLADEKILKEYNIEKIRNLICDKQNSDILFLDSRNNNIKKIVDKKILKLCADIYNKNAKKNIKSTLIKAMVIGMPNVGKSTFINSYVKRKANKVEDKPGITKDLKWTKISDFMLLLDTPGITIKKFENDDVGINLALVGSINDNILDKQDLAYEFLKKCYKKYVDLFITRYKLKCCNKNSKPLDVMNEIAINNVCYKKNGDIDYEKVANILINDFRKGNIGKISLE